MAKRKIYLGNAGEPYFKGEGFIFYLPFPNTTGLKKGDTVEVTSISCGQGNCAMATYIDANGKRRNVASD